MPLLTDEQLHAIRQLIADHHSAFVVNTISPESVAPEILKRLQEQGLVSPEINSIEDAYLYGMIIAASQDPKVQKMSLAEFRDHIRRNPVPLSGVEQRAMELAQHRAAQFAVGLGATFDVMAGQTIITQASEMEQQKMSGQIKDLTAEAVAKRKSTKQLASDLKWATKDWTRDWDRIAVTELNNAHQQAIADEYAGKYGPDVRVARRPAPDACRKCKELYLVGGVGPPRVFKLSELIANGTNFKKKQADWQPTATSLHPWCGCQTVRVPAGWGFDENWDLMPGGDREDYEEASEVRRALELEDDLRKAFKLQDHIDFQGIPIAIENRKSTTRTWTDQDGNKGETHMQFAYGYAKRTGGNDGDEIDVYVGPDPQSQRVFLVHQLDPSTGRYDEDKAFLGFRNEKDVKRAYLAHMDVPEALGSVSAMDMDAFKRLVALTKPTKGHEARPANGPLVTIPFQKAIIKPRHEEPQLVLHSEAMKELGQIGGDIIHEKIVEADKFILKAGPKRQPVLFQKALPRRTTSPLPSSGNVSTEIGAMTSPAAFRAPGHGTFPNFLPGSLPRTPVTPNKDVIGYSPNEKTPEDVERTKMRIDPDDYAGYHEPVPVDPRPVEKPDQRYYIGLQGPMVHPGREGVDVVTSEASQQWHPRDGAGIDERGRNETDAAYYDQALDSDDPEKRIRQELPIDSHYAETLHQRDERDRDREQAERKRLEENERKGRQRPKNIVQD